MTPPLAHFGHVLIDLPLFGGPVIFLGVALWWSTVRSRRDEREAARGTPKPG